MREAVSNVAHNLADLLTGTVHPQKKEATPVITPTSSQQPSVKKNNTPLYAVLGGLLLVAVAALAHGSGSGSSTNNSSQELPAAPTKCNCQ